MEQRGENEYFCSMCTVTFDFEAYAEALGCPGCRDMSEQQARMQEAGIMGGL